MSGRNIEAGKREKVVGRKHVEMDERSVGEEEENEGRGEIGGRESKER